MLFKTGGITLLLISLATFLLAIEAGYRLGRRRLSLTDEPERSHTNALQGATLGLLALLLGFTFAMAVQRYDLRRVVIVDQANAIGTAELRSRLLPPPHAENAGRLLREYVSAWMAYRAAGIDSAAIEAAETHAAQLEARLWEIARQVSLADSDSNPAELFTEAMNHVIDLHEKRHRSIEDHVPEVVIFLLFAVSTLALGQVAYSSGLSGRRRPIANLTFAFVIALVLNVIMDVDRPRRGLIQVSHDSMIRLQHSLGAPKP